ncbi:MAG: type I methionyl aminopeptidase, partial [Longispora sp.]|nr:type I methionyl aminopeptidase [Longispora sp. (in: high G+C Gram-positive bacteria)]
TPEQLHKMRAAGLVVADTLAKLREAVHPGISTGELDSLAEDNIRAAGAIPSFKGYHGFPGTICASVNEQVVHGIPRKTQILRDGDLVSIDCGAILDGWHGDSAITVPVGDVAPELLKMIEAAEAGMWAGIAAAQPGARLSDIGHAVEIGVRTVGKYGTVRGYGGHGIGTEMHQDPHVHNYGRPGRGPVLEPGIALAIEPMITAGSAKVVELNDGWTVVTKDSSMAVHVEHTIGVFEDGIWVLTAHDGGVGSLPASVLSAVAKG